MKPKESRIAVRVSAELKNRLIAITVSTGVDEATIIRNCIQALIDHVEKYGELTFPITLNKSSNPALGDRYPDKADEGIVVEEKNKKHNAG